MALTIEVPELVLLRASEQGALLLPDVYLGPAGGNLPHLVKLTGTVSGSPWGFVRKLQQAYQAAWKGYQFPPDKPRRVNSRGKVPPVTVTLDGPLPPDVNCELRLEGAYYDEDANGRPILDAPNAKGKRESRLLTVRVVSRLVARKPGKCELRLAPVTVVARAGKETTDRARLVLRARDLPPGTLPGMRLAAPEEVTFLDLRQELVAALRRPPQRTAVDPARAEETYEWELQLTLGEETRQALARRSETEPLKVAIAAEVPGRPEATLAGTLEVRCEESVFPGWLAIDFGTSNSTVTVFDDHRLVNYPGLPPEQENFLCRELLEWTRMPSGNFPNVAEADWGRYLDRVGQELGGTGVAELTEVLRLRDSRRLEAVLRLLELVAADFAEPFQVAVVNKLHALYYEAFRVPPLESQQLFAVELDLTNREKELLSETEVTGLRPAVTVEMGQGAKQNRLSAIGRAADPTADPAEVEQDTSRFIHSPKRYFGKKFRRAVWLGGEKRDVSSAELVQAAWKHLIDMTDRARRQNKKLADGRFREVLVTYPTSASPAVRNEILRGVRELGIPDPLFQLYFDVKNLFFYLSCSFLRSFQNSNEAGEIFPAGTELTRLDEQPIGKARTVKWDRAVQEEITITRQDFRSLEGKTTRHDWGSFPLRKALGFGGIEEFFRFANDKQLQVLFEVDHQLRMKLYVCQGDPHYEIRSHPDRPPVNIKDKFRDLPPLPAGDGGPKVEYDILLNVQAARLAGHDAVLAPLVRADTPFDRTFHFADKTEPRPGLICPLLEEEFVEPGGGGARRVEVYARRRDGDEVRQVAVVLRPADDSGYKRRYFVTVDQHGYLQVHVGEVPFWMGDKEDRGDPMKVRERAGLVFVQELTPPQEEVGKELDPFCGLH
jgi:hypothetical protein